jgi:hypothetical protein
MAQELKHQKLNQDADDFRLTAEQMVFMINIDAAAEFADQANDYEFFDKLTISDEWKSLFGEMSWDNVYDRYEIMIAKVTQ